MNINLTNEKEIAYSILSLVNSLEIQFGKTTLSQILHGSKTMNVKHKHMDGSEYYGCLSGFSLEQIKNIIDQLLTQQYLKTVNIGIDYEMIVVNITEKGKQTLERREDVHLILPKIYAPEFNPASNIPIINQNILDEFYQVKSELKKLEEKEAELKNIIKDCMIKHNLPQIHTINMDLFCKKIERTTYPKEKIETYVPADILEKIKTVSESVVLTAKLR